MSLELNKKQKNHSLAMALLKGRTLIVLAILVIFFSLASPNFLTTNTLLLLAKHVALYGILAIGMTYVIITGGIDLSVGAVVGLGRAEGELGPLDPAPAAPPVRQAAPRLHSTSSRS